MMTFVNGAAELWNGLCKFLYLSWRRSLLCLMFFGSAAVEAQPGYVDAPCDNPTRLHAIARLWSDVKWFSPKMANQNSEWDEALVRALPTLMCARDSATLKSALELLIAPLSEPDLGVTSRDDIPYVRVDAGQAMLQWASPGILLARLNGAAGQSNVPFDINEFSAKYVPNANLLVIDYRAASRSGIDDHFFDELIASVIDARVTLPADRVRIHSGYAPQSGPPSEYFFSAQRVSDSRTIAPKPGLKRLPLVFLTNGNREIPGAILALQHRGDALIVSEGSRSANWTRVVRHQTFEFGLEVRYSAGELVFDDGCTGFAIDGSVSGVPDTAASTSAIQEAIEIGQNWKRNKSPLPLCKSHPFAITGTRENGYPSMRMPELEWRQLAVVKLWSVIDTFYPYKLEIAETWQKVLPLYFNKMRDVTSARDYALMLTEMAAKIGDSHVFARNRETRQFFGESKPDLELAMIDSQVVVRKLNDTISGLKRPIVVGDVILAVDGTPVLQKMLQLAPYISGSNPPAKQRSILSYLLAGSKGSAVRILVENRRGEQFELEVPRDTVPTRDAVDPEIPFRSLGLDIYYVDLTQLQRGQVDSMFEAAGSSRAIIFDLRGYPKETGWDIAARLMNSPTKRGPIFRRPFVSPGESGEMTVFVQTLDPSSKTPYEGRVVILIDERTISQSEHTALLFESVASTTYIGSNTAGTDGDVTNVILPGNMMVAFSGFAVSRYSGLPLHPTGIEPHIKVKPTLKGLRQGKDEVLEAALRFLRSSDKRRQ